MWHLPDGNSLSSKDSTANRNHGSINGTAATNGAVGGAASFNGTSAYIQGTNTIINIPKVTVSAMVKLTATPTAAGMAVGFVNGSDKTVYDKIIYVDTANKPRFYVFDGASKHTSVPATGLVVGKWHMLHATADGTNAKLYLDGVQVGSVAAGNTYANYTAKNIFINGYQVSQTYLKAAIDEVRVINSARSGNWIWAEFLNSASNTVFNQYGVVVMVGEQGTIFRY